MNKTQKAMTLIATLGLSSAAHAAITISGNAYTVSASNSFHSSAANGGLQGFESFNGVADNDNRWATAFSEGPVRNEWLVVDLGGDVILNTISVDWERARAQDYTWGLRTAAQGLPTGITTGTPGSVTYSDWSTVATVDTDPAGQYDGGSAGTADQLFDFAVGAATPTQELQHPDETTLTIDQTAPTGRYLIMAITENWSRAQSDGSSPYEIEIDATAVPEPSSALLGLLGLGFLARRKRA